MRRRRGVAMTENDTIRCNFCGRQYDGAAANCPGCNFPSPGTTPAGTVSNKRIESSKVLLVAGIAVLAVAVAIGVSVLVSGDDEPVAQSPGSSTIGDASTRAEAWSSTVNGAVTSQVALPDAVVVSTSDRLTRIDADGSDAWIASLAADADVVAEASTGEYVLTENTSGNGVGAYDVASGEQRWFLDGLTFVAAAPGGAIVRAGDGPFGLVDHDGGLAWRVEANEQAAIPASGEQVEVVFVRTGPRVVGLDVADGQERWSLRTSFKVGGGDPLGMAATNDMVVLGGPGQVLGLDADTGEQLWKVDGNGTVPQVQQFGPDLVAVAFDADSATVLYDANGERATLTGTSRSTMTVVPFDVDGTSYAADVRNSSVYDSAGSRVGTYPEGTFTPAPDGYFVTAANLAMHFTVGASAADYTVPAPSGSSLAPLTNRVVVSAGANLRGY